MPKFNALAALNLVKDMKIDIPFIVISGTIGEALAVEAMRAGAHDYLIKTNLARLVPVIEREINEAENRRARRAAEESVRRQSAALQVAANAIVIVNREREILWANLPLPKLAIILLTRKDRAGHRQRRARQIFL